MVCRSMIYFIDLKIFKYYQKACGWNSKSTKTKNYVTNYARYNCTIIQTLYKFLTTKKWLWSLTTLCKLLHPCYCFMYWGVAKNILLFLDEQIKLMPFYYAQDLYQKNQLVTRLDKRLRGLQHRGGGKESRHSFTK